MKKISLWAKQNKKTARFALVLLHLLLIFSGIAMGLLIYCPVAGPLFWGFILTGLVYGVAFCNYPTVPRDSRLGSAAQTYRFQKICDFTLAISACLMIGICSSQFFSCGTATWPNTVVNQVIASKGKKPTAEQILQSMDHRSRKDLSGQEKRILKREFILQIGAYAKAKMKGDNQLAAKIALVTLTIVAAVGLAYLIAGLSCSLSCSGAQGLAVVVLLLGTIGVVFGTILLVRAILRMSKNLLVTL